MILTRRHLLETTGVGLAAAGSAAVFSACGGEGRPEPNSERDVELLGEVREAQAVLADAYRVAEEQRLANPVAAAFGDFAGECEQAIDVLGSLIESSGGSPASPTATSQAPAESAVEAVRIDLEGAIAAALAAVGHLSSEEARRAVASLAGADGARLAVVRGILGEDQAPYAFVTGRPEPPLGSDPDPAPNGEEED